MSNLQPKLTLISHTLCPYVQRAAIALSERGVPFERIDIDLGNKPDWFLRISPLGKVPVLLVDDRPIFESAAILEFLEDTLTPRLHPHDPLDRARHRAWMEFGSSQLNLIAGLYNAADVTSFQAKADALGSGFQRLENILGDGPYFAGEEFSLVDAVYGPIFRYFDVFDEIGDFGIMEGLEKVTFWRRDLAVRPSIARAVSSEYPVLLRDFLLRRDSYLSTLIAPAQKSA